MQASNILPNGGQIISSLVLGRILVHNKVVSKKRLSTTLALHLAILLVCTWYGKNG